ncbi:hypothetical protein RhiLY_05461 [Ceratobasidium sp. AG-Ba]|nr:hypothetical protein RhiLY_05461 [Ceratobasidium sp. AG-Ba]
MLEELLDIFCAAIVGHDNDRCVRPKQLGHHSCFLNAPKRAHERVPDELVDELAMELMPDLQVERDDEEVEEEYLSP